MMKPIIQTIFFTCIFCLFISCEKNEVLIPKATMNINQKTFTINESMVINFVGTADQIVIFTGDNMHDYELRDKSNTGFVVNKNLFTYSYTSPGIYKVVCVATTYKDLAKDLKRDTSSYIITVIDDETEIEKLSCPQILYDEVFASKLDHDEWLMTLPRRVKYGTSNPAITLSQRLKFYFKSDSTKVFINSVKFSPTARYDLSNTLKITVQSPFGTEQLYNLYTLYYPEFLNFKLLNIDGDLVRNEYNYSSFELNINLPTGTDLTNLIPQFTTTSSDDKVYIGNVEQTSGSSSVNFSNEVTYTLISTLPNDDTNKKAISTVTVKVNN